MRILVVLLAVILAGCAGPRYAVPSVASADIERVRQAGSSEMVLHDRSPEEVAGLVGPVGRRLSEAAAELCPVVEAVDCRFKFVVVLSPTPAALVDGKGRIAISVAMLALLGNDDEVAAVLAHEMGHRLADHPVVMPAPSMAPTMLGNVKREAYLAWRQDLEREADYLGAYLMGRAGYDVSAAAAVMGRFAPLDQRRSYWSLHPPSAERAAVFDKLAEEIAAKRAAGAALLPER